MFRAVVVGGLFLVVGCNRNLVVVPPTGSGQAGMSGQAGAPGTPVDASTPPDVRPGADRYYFDGGGAVDHAPASDAVFIDTRRPPDAAPEVGATDATPADALPPPPARGCYSSDAGTPPPVGTLFGAPMTIDLASGAAESVAIGDVTGDGLPDVVVGEGNFIIVYAQTAGGTLAPAASYDSGIGGQVSLEPRTLDVGDVNGDGRLDVVYTREVDVAVMLQNASGGLDPPLALAITDAGNGEDVVAVGDLDGDGRADVVGASWGGLGVDIWFQAADGSLAAARHFACPHSGYEDLALGDLDGDGQLDIAISGEQQSTICVLLQRPGGFATEITTPGVTTRGLGIADVEGDCNGDLIFATGGNRPGSQIGLMAGAGGGALGQAAYLPSYDIPGALVVRDVDGDGRPDVVVNHEGWLAIGVYRQLPWGGFAAEEQYPFSYINWGPDRIAVGDINGDGRPDIVGVDAKVTILYHQ
jgi:hypothetical protein